MFDRHCTFCSSHYPVVASWFSEHCRKSTHGETEVQHIRSLCRSQGTFQLWGHYQSLKQRSTHSQIHRLSRSASVHNIIFSKSVSDWFHWPKKWTDSSRTNLSVSGSLTFKCIIQDPVILIILYTLADEFLWLRIAVNINFISIAATTLSFITTALVIAIAGLNQGPNEYNTWH